MPWVRLDDKFPDHEKVAKAGPLASWLYVCGLAYSNRMLTDGFIPCGVVRRLADVENAMDLAEHLVAAGMWEPVDGGYQIHDYAEYQPTKEHVESISETRAEAGRRGGKQRASKLLERSQHSAQANGQAKSKPVPNPVPVAPTQEQDLAKAHSNGRVTAPSRAKRDPMKRREPEECVRYEPDLFARLWAFWGKVGSVEKAGKAWDELQPSRDLMQVMRLAIDRQRDAWRWGEPGGQAQPHLSTWLNEHRWHMEPIPNKVEAI